MIQEEFDTAKWYKGMHCYTYFGKKLEVIAVDFIYGIIVVKGYKLDRTRENYHFSEIKLESK